MKKKISPIIFLQATILLILSSCEFNDHGVDKGYYTENFDNLYTFDRNTNAISTEHAHSGFISMVADSLNPFGKIFQMNMDFIRNNKYKKAEISGWIFKPEYNTQAGLIAEIQWTGGSSSYKSFDIGKDVIITNSWIKVAMSIDLDVKSELDQMLKIYLWSPKGQKIFMDDLTVHFIKAL